MRGLTQQRHLGFSLDLLDASLRLPHYWSEHADVLACRCLINAVLCHELEVNSIRLLGFRLGRLCFKGGFILASNDTVACFIKVIFDGLFLTELIGVKCHSNGDILRPKEVSEDKRILSWNRAIKDNDMLRRLFLVIHNLSCWIHHYHWNELGGVATLYVVGTLDLSWHMMANGFEQHRVLAVLNHEVDHIFRHEVMHVLLPHLGNLGVRYSLCVFATHGLFKNFVFKCALDILWL